MMCLPVASVEWARLSYSNFGYLATFAAKRNRNNSIRAHLAAKHGRTRIYNHHLWSQNYCYRGIEFRRAFIASPLDDYRAGEMVLAHRARVDHSGDGNISAGSDGRVHARLKHSRPLAPASGFEQVSLPKARTFSAITFRAGAAAAVRNYVISLSRYRDANVQPLFSCGG
jgi:hypothetical protein